MNPIELLSEEKMLKLIKNNDLNEISNYFKDSLGQNPYLQIWHYAVCDENCTILEHQLVRAAKNGNRRLVVEVINKGAIVKKGIQWAYERYFFDPCTRETYITLLTVLLDCAQGVDFENLLFLRGIKACELNFRGVSVKGVPVTYEMLTDFQIKDVVDILLTKKDQENIKDVERKQWLLSYTQACCDKLKTLNHEGILNLVSLSQGVALGNIEIVQACLSRGCVSNELSNLLVCAVKNENVEILALLLKSMRQNPQQIFNHLCYPTKQFWYTDLLLYAIDAQKAKPILSILKQYGIRFDIILGDGSLIGQVVNSLPDYARLMECIISKTDIFGNPIEMTEELMDNQDKLIFRILKDKLELIDYLLENGVNLSVREPLTQKTPLHVLLTKKSDLFQFKGLFIELLKRLTHANTVNLTDELGNSAVMYALLQTDIFVMLFLVLNGANINQPNLISNLTSLDLAIVNLLPTTAKCLINIGANYKSIIKEELIKIIESNASEKNNLESELFHITSIKSRRKIQLILDNPRQVISSDVFIEDIMLELRSYIDSLMPHIAYIPLILERIVIPRQIDRNEAKEILLSYLDAKTIDDKLMAAIQGINQSTCLDNKKEVFYFIINESLRKLNYSCTQEQKKIALTLPSDSPIKSPKAETKELSPSKLVEPRISELK